MKELAAYGAAKAAAEAMATHMNCYLPTVHVVVKRLPRLDTDQTLSLLPVESGSALEEMIKVVDAMSSRTRD